VPRLRQPARGQISVSRRWPDAQDHARLRSLTSRLVHKSPPTLPSFPATPARHPSSEAPVDRRPIYALSADADTQMQRHPSCPTRPHHPHFPPRLLRHARRPPITSHSPRQPAPAHSPRRTSTSTYAAASCLVSRARTSRSLVHLPSPHTRLARTSVPFCMYTPTRTLICTCSFGSRRGTQASRPPFATAQPTAARLVCGTNGLVARPSAPAHLSASPFHTRRPRRRPPRPARPTFLYLRLHWRLGTRRAVGALCYSLYCTRYS
jgi:hypothetical protein